MVCKNVDGHKGAVFKGRDCSDKVFVRNQHVWCKCSTCPVCFISGWGVRQANVIKVRLDEAVERGFGAVEHIVVSIPKSDYGLFYKDLRLKALVVLRRLRVLGGCMIFHGYRIDRSRRVLLWSPHFHVLGFIRGGYRCRECERKWNCRRGCGGFDDRSYQKFLKDGYFVKVFDERKTVHGSAWYQLNHATVKIGIGRFQITTWFGSLSCRSFKRVSPLRSVGMQCKLCGEVMSRGLHVGERFVAKNLNDERYVKEFVDDAFDKDGNPNYVD